ncbi:hypothetical protein [Streptomyces sp. UH6]|uniref:hypothetical protein n=1 Tax=Streptomyces sp. UH6 TaxID=2748379 RepID=UPI0015D49825|nr:hypothetical protein [Streptomyces sp. UH6]NYV77464.1 hypothetical protein [Streptomyces sp. UH6]
MNQNCKAAMAAAVAGGYLLGRTKKAKLALAVGTYLAGRRFSMSPSQLATQGLTKLRETPQFQDLTDQVRHEVLNAGRSAVTAAARRKLLDLSDSLRDRGERLSGAAGRGDRDEDDGYADDDSAYDEEPVNEADEDDEDDEDAYDRDDAYDEDEAEDEADGKKPAAGSPGRRTSAGSAGLRSSVADRGTARRATVRRAASTGPSVANAAVKKRAATKSGSGSGTRRGK